MCLKILITLIDKKISILIAKQLQGFSMAIHVRPKFTLRSSAIHATRRYRLPYPEHALAKCLLFSTRGETYVSSIKGDTGATKGKHTCSFNSTHVTCDLYSTRPDREFLLSYINRASSRDAHVFLEFMEVLYCVRVIKWLILNVKKKC